MRLSGLHQHNLLEKEEILVNDKTGLPGLKFELTILIDGKVCKHRSVLEILVHDLQRTQPPPKLIAHWEEIRNFVFNTHQWDKRNGCYVCDATS